MTNRLKPHRGKREGAHILALVITMTILSPRTSHAYLDPGTGSLILQVLAGAFFAGAMTFRLWWAKLKGFVSGVIHPGKEENE